MIRRLLLLALAGLVSGNLAAQSTYLGFDRNQYPGDENLKALRETFAFVGYWLNTPPGETHQEWRGKRQAVESAGFGFLVLFNARLYAQLKNEENAARIGKKDAAEAAASARREGFPGQTVIFLDQEEGGRMLPEQKGIHPCMGGRRYCSGISRGSLLFGKRRRGDRRKHRYSRGHPQNAGGRKISYFVTKECVSALAGMHVFSASTAARGERRRLRRFMAVCTVAEASGYHGGLR